MAESVLPAEFKDLEVWSDWSLETEKQRTDRRHASSMSDLRAFYDVMLQRTQDALTYLEKYPLDDMPEDATRLLWLTLSLAEVAPATEQFGQPSVVDGYDYTRVEGERRF